jgi:RND family efflux transporter MFP subunit
MSATKPSLDDLKIHRPHGREPGSKLWLVVVAIVALVLAAGAWWWRSTSGTVPVHTALAREIGGKGSERTVLNASGYVTARRAATASSKVTGKVVEVLIEEGMHVKEGQVLARLDDTNVKATLAVVAAQLDSAKKNVEETRAQLRQADLEYQRTIELAKNQIASQSDLDKAESDAKTLQARLVRQENDVVVAEKQLASVKQDLEDLTIRAPFDGIVTTKDSQPGEMISPISAGGGFTRTGIGTVVDMQSLEIEIDVNESYINRVVPGQAVEATLDAYPDLKFPCKVIAIIPTADRQKATVKVRVGFDKLDPRVLPEMAVKVAFHDTATAAPSRMIVIPRTSLKNQDGRDVVFTVKEGRAERRAVTVSSAEGDQITLAAGISAGDKVIVDSPEGLVDGVKVKERKP